MADAIVTIKIMPSSPSSDLTKIERKAKHIVEEFGGEVGKVEIEPVAFGLNALKLIIVYNEKKGGPDILEEKIAKIDDVNSVDTIDVRRAIG